MKLLRNIICIGIAISSADVFAAAAGGSDWCGLGWSVTQKKSLVGTSTRETTHYFLPPTFSMTTGTSNCDQHSLVQKDKPSVEFVALHYQPLMDDAARGKGEYVSALASLMGCSGNSIVPFNREMNRLLPTMVEKNSSSPGEFIHNLKFEMGKNPELKNSCGIS